MLAYRDALFLQSVPRRDQMAHANFQLILVASAFFGLIDGVPSITKAEEFAINRCSGARTVDCCESSCCVDRFCGACCNCCDRICQFQLVDGCTKCAWSRTWNSPNALATPLRRYYVPRPPQCCWCDGCGNRDGHWSAGNSPLDATNCQSRTIQSGNDISSSAAAGFSPAQFERLGKIPNELDVAGPTGGANSPARPAAPAR